jgi:putative two-component system response regulator
VDALDKHCMDVLVAFADTVMNMHDPRNDEHNLRCVLLTNKLGAKLKLPRREIDLTNYAMHLHDIGKVGIPENILAKPVLTDSEMDQMRGHSVRGADLVAELLIRDAGAISELIRHHHSNWDGTGYPDKLAGDQIPIGAQIIRIVDFFDAITNERVYHMKLSTKDALKLMETKRGTWLSPEIFDLFKQIVNNDE